MLKIYPVCLIYLLIGTDVVRCKPDYLFKHEARGWLKLHTFPATWEEAFLRCHYEGAVLASPLSMQLLNTLRSIMHQSNLHGPSYLIYIGTHDLFSTGDFISAEGVSLPDSKIKLDRTETGNCLTMSRYDYELTYMRTSSCDRQLPFICYRKLDNQTMNECGTFDNDYYLNQHTGSCYKLHRQPQTWTRAYRICASEGGHLVILNDDEEAHIVTESFIKDYNSQYPFHLGLLAWGEDCTWLTIHGDRLEDVYHNGVPDDCGNGHWTGSLGSDGMLFYGSAENKHMFICEKSPDSIRFEAPPLATEEGMQ